MLLVKKNVFSILLFNRFSFGLFWAMPWGAVPWGGGRGNTVLVEYAEAAASYSQACNVDW